MRDIVAQLKTLEVDMSDTFMVHYILNTYRSNMDPSKSPRTHIRKKGQLMNY